MYVCVPYECSAHRGRKMALDPLETELQVVVNCHPGAIYQTRGLSKSRQCFQLLSHLKQPTMQ